MRAVRLSVVTAAATAAALAAVTGCTEKSDAKADDGTVTVVAKDDSCEVSKKEFPAGHVNLAVENRGSKVTEVYVLYPDDRIVTERENIGPGTKASLTAEIKAGDYEIACKPGMVGDGIRQQVKATGGAAGAKRSPEMDAAVAAYRQYVQAQADATLPKVKVFTDAVRAGDVEAAKKAYAASRIGWERTEPVAESFGDIDPKVDVREDGLEAGQDPAKDWTGWHRLEKALWQDKKIGDREKQLADTLDKDLADWAKRVGKAEITPTSMANGAKELLDEVATGKVTGEEERYSRTDLVDFKANVEGAQKSFDLLKPVATKNDPKLVAELDKQFAALNTLLDKYRADKTGYDFTSYDKVGKPERKELSDGVNALAEPLSKLAAAVVK
ncbi:MULTISPECIES: iron uptake system protein EfeO [Streptomyces]|uniref:Ferrous iron transport periplasmic protein EfeO,contains peptidase-M75 domain and (Frequently) cupredoxin domain n=1 Tax=Streptomyces venezuelae (strain ATCC 10712 / CBS 650.69 / DSM 40230 / JCM 4526 / NBRC 13096 / PD 04745) TaxID=953739 RepID=F2RJN2_STRVP|nr:iron uptake system protein EfeO [Streptomyces venezuelae]APE21245.1 peptidase M75 [Streptomyces venezuelae]QER98637.1 peptidase M75 family protein [Streptomyces venezuelae ATCC 10712]CCA55242.1 Ferrous iron transport periplasmic protein EfeO,contains peptidase-M75 domain and (frequently) cupredoxin domain [Streptomyces venezuelae ATCC 10712]